MKRILGFEQFVINENTKVNDVEYSYSTVNEAVITRNDIDKIRGLDLKTFLLKTLWTNSVEMFYGKGYKGDPSNDNTIITVGGTSWALGMSGHGNETAGAVFTDAWKETDDFINRTVELIEKGSISDFWKSFGKVAGWAGIAALVVGTAIVFPPAIPAYTTGVATIFGTFANVGSTLAFGLGTGAVVGINSAAILGGIGGLYFLSQSDNRFNSAYQFLTNKDKFINDVKEILSNHSDFEADWGLDTWLAGIQGMPGWRKSKLPQVINYDAEKIGWLYIDMMARATHTYIAVKTITEVSSVLQDLGYEIKDNGDWTKKGSGQTPPQTQPGNIVPTQPLKGTIQNSIDYNLLSDFWVKTGMAIKDSTGNIVKASNQSADMTTVLSKFYGIVHNWKMGGYNDVSVAIENIKNAMGKYWNEGFRYTLYDILTNKSRSAKIDGVKKTGVRRSSGGAKPATTTAPGSVTGSYDYLKVGGDSTAYDL